jgi:salicylate hydroxylase
LFPCSAIHRGDYQKVLVAEAKAIGAKLMLDSEVIKVDRDTQDAAGRQVVLLKNGGKVTADVVIGADGMSSLTTI